MPPASVGWAEALGAVESMARRVSSLIRSIPDPATPALGVWTAGQLAAHLTHVYEVDLDLLNEVPPPLDDLADLGELTQAKVDDEAVYDPPALADRVERAAAGFLSVARGMHGAEPRVWVGGVKVTATVLACHILNESMVHGLDLASVTGGRWKIEQGDARLAFEGFICPMYRSLGRPEFAVHPEKAAGVRATYDIRVRGGGRWFFAFENGGLVIEEPSDRRVDCHLWADPRAIMLLAWHRTGLPRPVVKMQVLPWGRRPWLAFRLPGLLRLP
ncbi:MAG TPA: maleylpyruvate isomerase N-terminal domain-containing protein [Acidimicrobiales bacterium]|nr:maleylpyruvate isomerase N-terminal domain-containing protein [Acidimicrobiales bacterium]